MSSWYEHYVGRMNDSYLDHVRKRYGPFIKIIRELMPKSDHCRVAEVGCGAANITRILDEKIIMGQHCRHIILDKCPLMLGLAHQNLADNHVNHLAILGNALNLPTEPMTGLSVIHSHGVLEHFSDKHINRIINEQKMFCSNLVHYVPSHRYEKPSFGDERLLSVDDWYRICRPDEIVQFNDGYDLALIWRRDG